RTSGVTALAEMRSMISLLRSDGRDAVAAPPRLDRLDDLLTTSRAAGVEVEAAIDVGTLGEISAATEQAVYRIVQEALTNAVKYASGPVAVSVGRDGTDVVVEVRSCGRGDAGPNGGGVGLV